jgi:hypothetical protein
VKVNGKIIITELEIGVAKDLLLRKSSINLLSENIYKQTLPNMNYQHVY